MDERTKKGSSFEPLAVSVTKASKMLDISRPTMYDLMRREDFNAVFRIGGRTLISVDGLREWVKAQIGKEVSA